MSVLSPYVQDPRQARYLCFTGRALRSFDPSCLTIFKQAELVHGGLHLEIVIIGESHYVIVSDSETGEWLFVELLACVDIEKAGYEPSFLLQVEGCASLDATIWPASDEKELAIRLALEEPTKKRNSPKTFNQGDACSIDYIFDGPMQPRTVVRAEIYQGDNGLTLTLRTLHEYVTPDGEHVETLTSHTNLVFTKRSET